MRRALAFAIAALLLAAVTASSALSQPMTRILDLSRINLVLVGDLNNDGRWEMLTIEDVPGGPQIVLRDAGTGEIWAITTAPAGTLPDLTVAPFLLEDLDEDQHVEVIYLSSADDNVRSFEVPDDPDLPGFLQISQQWSFHPPSQMQTFAPIVASFDGAHLFMLYEESAEPSVWRIRDRFGALVQTIAPNDPPMRVELWDVEPDGAVEIAFLHPPEDLNRIELYRWTSPVLAAAPSSGGPMLRMLGAHPARGQALLSYRLPASSEVELVVHDAQGRRVRGLVHGRVEAGDHQVRWGGDDDEGRPVSSGAYFVELRAAGTRVGRKLVWIR